MMGPQLEIADQMHADKYRGPGENFREAMGRIANAMKDDHAHFHHFRDILMEMRFMPAGRIQTAMGSTRQVTAQNCFVSGTIEDSFVAGEGSIMNRAAQAAMTMRMGGGIGYDFSTLRPRGALIKKLQSRSSGPVSFMDIFDAVCRCTASSGHRRGAQMGVLRVDHPDIEEFVLAKQNDTRFHGFNFSIAITDEFMEAAAIGSSFDLRWGGQTYQTVDAQSLWDTIMRSTWDWAEPGVLFIDRMNEMNNLHYCETIAATNPCGEQPLPPHGACLLGSFNLTRYIFERPVRELNAGVLDEKCRRRWNFDWRQFSEDIPAVVRAMDNVVDRSIYPLFEQEKEAHHKRRMGLGITGLANTAEALGYSYGSDEFISFQNSVLETLLNHSYEASMRLGIEKGSFPMFDSEKYCQSKFLQKALSPDLIKDICSKGIRNSHLTSIAPTGTISFCADNISSGIEPVFAHKQERRVVDFDRGHVDVEIQDYAVRNFDVYGKTTAKVTAQEHVRVLTTAAGWVDSAVSKTCNVSPDTPWDDFKDIYRAAWEGGAKGCTTFNKGGKRFGILVDVDSKNNDESLKKSKTSSAEVCYIDPESGQRECG